jgi:hypothetical protein
MEETGKTIQKQLPDADSDMAKTEENGQAEATLTEAGRALKREYMREYKRRHREKLRQADIRYWNRKAAALAAQKGENDNE